MRLATVCPNSPLHDCDPARRRVSPYVQAGSRYVYTLVGVALAICALATPTHAQRVLFRTYTGEDGLSQSQVTSLTQDHEGYLWAGTDHGASRFDGLHFTNYSRNDGLAENPITATFTDSKGRVWFGHEMGSVSVYHHGHFQVFPAAGNQPRNGITAIAEDDKGRIWLSTETSGLLVAVDTSAGIVMVRPEGPADTILALRRGRRHFWIGTTDGLYSADVQSNRDHPEVLAFRWTRRGGKLMLNQAISALWEDRQGRLWIGTPDKGLFVLEEAIENDHQSSGRKLTVCQDLPQAPVEDIVEDHDGHIWVATKGKGVWRLKPQGENARISECRVFSLEDGLSYNHITKLLVDREGNLWLATFGAGLCKYEGSMFETTHFSNNPLLNSIWSILEDHQGTIWFGTEGGLVRYRLPKGNRTKPEARVFTTRDGLSHHSVRAVYEDRWGYLWLATKGGGLCRFDPRTEQSICLGVADGLPTNRLLTLVGGGEGVLWIGTHSRGVVRFTLPSEGVDPRGQAWRFQHFPLGAGNPIRSVYAMYRDRESTVWVAVLNYGLGKYMPPDKERGQGHFQFFRREHGLADEGVGSMTQDQDGLLWVSTFNGWLYSFDGSVFEEVGGPADFNSETIYLVACDRKNRLFVGTNTGLYRYDRQRDSFTHFRKSHRFLATETNVNAVCNERSGCIWFGTIDGAIRYDPDADRPNLTPPCVHITGVSVYLEPVAMVQEASFDHDQNHITFDFIGVSLKAPEQVQYSYMLEGFDKDWITSSERNYVTYSSLPYGTYTFMVKASNGDDVWSDAPQTYTFTILTPYWRTAWFYGICGVTLLGTAFGLFRWRTSTLARTNRQLEARVRERTEELSHRNQEIEKVNRALGSALESAQEASRAKATFLATMSHEIRTPLNGVLGMTELLLDSVLDDDQRECAMAIHSSGTALLSILNDVLDLSKIEAGRISLETIPFCCRDLVVEVVNLFAPRAEEKELELAYIIAPDIPDTMTADPHRLRQILSNLVGNAIKFTESGQVILRVELAPRTEANTLTIKFKVQDSGIGITSAGQAELFKPFTQVDTSYSRNYGGTGLGLAICRDLVQLMMGEIGVSSQPGEGSCFWFTFHATGEPVTTRRSKLEGQLICLVNDNSCVREIICEQLETAGADVLASACGDDLFEIPRHPDWLLIDEEVFRKDGLELARRIGQDASLSTSGLVLMVPFGQRPATDVQRELPGVTTITKPIHQHQLEALLCEHRTVAAAAGSVISADFRRRPWENTRVLIVDDNEINLVVALRMLEKLGCRTTSATSGQEALDLVTNEHFDIVFMDCQMPDIDGLEATERIRVLEVDRYTPIVALTANTMKSDRNLCLNIGMDDYLGKPFSTAELSAMIEKWVSKRPVSSSPALLPELEPSLEE